eukprot:243806-Pelagomonas_calceolata.AAC.2
MFLPSWGGPMSTNPYSKPRNACPHLCSTTLHYATPPSWVSKEIMLPCQSWILEIIAVWNTAARIRLNEDNPTWLTELAQDVPEAHWWKTSIKNDPFLDAKHPGIEADFKKLKKLPSDQQHIPKDIVQNHQLLSALTASSPNLVLKVQSWKSGSTQMAAVIFTVNMSKAISLK